MKTALLALCMFFCVKGVALARDCTVAQGDAQRVIDAVTTSGSPTLDSALGKFVPGDAGKVAFATNGSVTVFSGTILAYISATRVTLSGNASATTGGTWFVWATVDATSAFTTAVTNCKTSASTGYPGSNVYVGADAGTVRFSGNYIVSGCIYSVELAVTGVIPSFIGAGRYSSVLFMAPTMSACSAGPQLLVARGAGATFSGFTIDGGDIVRNTSAGLTSVYTSSEITISDVSILHWGTNNALSRCFTAVGTGDLSISRTKIQNAPTGSRDTGCEIGGNGVITDLLCSNHWRNLIVQSDSSRTPGSQGLTWIGGGADECGDSSHNCTTIADNRELQVIGATFFSTIKVGAGAVPYAINSNVGFYNIGNRGSAVTIAAGGKVVSTATTWRGNAGGKAVVNLGTFIDVGGTEFKDCTGFTCTSKTAAQAFQGYQPVSR